MALFLVPLVACTDWFDAVPDNGTIPDKKFFGDENAFYNALIDVYTQLRSNDLYGENLTLGMLEFMSQDFIPYDTPSTDISKFRYDTPENSTRIATVMREMYRAIASCNKILEEIEHTDVSFYNPGQKEIITGELYALRGALHFDLLRLFHPTVTREPGFSGLPYMTHFGTETSRPQTSSQLLRLILDDLSHAADLLREYDPILSGWNHSSVALGQIDNRLRTFYLNYYAVTALQARIYLYMGDYKNALERAQETYSHLQKVEVSSQLFYFVSPGKYNSDFCFSREHIWGISSMPDGFTALSDTMFRTNLITVRSDISAVFPMPTIPVSVNGSPAKAMEAIHCNISSVRVLYSRDIFTARAVANRICRHAFPSSNWEKCRLSRPKPLTGTTSPMKQPNGSSKCKHRKGTP